MVHWRTVKVVHNFAFVFVLSIVLPPANAQSTNASLIGRVTDPSKALIVGAKIAAISGGTNTRYEVVTNSSGGFYLTDMLPGTYRIEIEKAGFKKLIKTDVALHVQDALEINVEMTLGSASETITVEAGAPALNTEWAAVNTVIDRSFVENLPLNGRSFQTLIMLTPGVVVTATAFDDQGQFSANGQRADANYFTVDGVSANFGVTGFAPLMQSAGGALPALGALGGTNSLVSVEAMLEFRIQTFSFAPEFGRTPGAQISVVTRSGTNGFHSTMFDYFRNGALDAKDWFSNLNHLPKSHEQQNDFGGVLGGPIRKDKTFADSIAHQSDALLSRNFSLYGQDTCKITPKLTLTYGLRWDMNPPPNGKNSANDPFTVEDLNDPSTLTLAPRGTPLYKTTYGNVAPRFGLAYQLSESSDWGSVLRGGIGVFYDLGSGSLGGVSSFFPYSATRVFSPAQFPLSPQNATPPILTVNPPVLNLFVADPSLKLPRTYQWNIALEQALGSSQTLSVTYVGALGRDLLRSTVLNPAAVGNPNFNFVYLTDNTATADYNALQLKFQRRLFKGLQVLASYSFSHSIDIASTDAAFAELDPVGSVTSPKVDRGDSDFDIRHSFTAAITYDLPVFGPRNVIRNVFGNWSLDSRVIIRSSPPVDIVGAQISAGVAVFMPRPDINPGLPLVLYGSQYPGGKAFNPAAFAPPPSGQQGNLGRNVLRGFGAWQADVSLQRGFHLTEKLTLRFRAEFFNIFNHPNFGSPNNTLTNPLFGQSTQTLANGLAGGNNAGFNPLYQIGGPRSIQLALKLQF
jgi:hypothetical protein